MITDFVQLKNLIQLQDCSYDEFCDRIAILNISDTTGTFAVRSDLITFLDRVSKKDQRKSMLHTYQKKLYNMLVKDSEKCLSVWFEKYVELKGDISSYLFLPSGSCLSDGVFDGTKHSKYGRLAKNINFHDFYNTKKLYQNDSEYVLGLMKVMFEKFHLRNSLASPAFCDKLCN